MHSAVDIYVGGAFVLAGLGDDQVACDGLAVLRGDSGVWEGYVAPFPVKRLASSGSTVFVASSQCAAQAEELYLTTLNTDTGEFVELSSLPVNGGGASSTACITGLAAYDNMLYVSGTFILSIPEESDLVYGVVVYDIDAQSWHSIGIPSTIAAPSGNPTYAITSFTFSENSGSSHVLLGGYFEFETESFSYTSLAKYNIDFQVWESTAALNDQGAVLDLSGLVDSNEAIVGGTSLNVSVPHYCCQGAGRRKRID